MGPVWDSLVSKAFAPPNGGVRFPKAPLLLLAVLLIGCSNPPDDPIDEISPPKFDLGDLVSIEDSLKVGIVVSSQRTQITTSYNPRLYEWHWVYEVMFQNNNIKYKEENLVLVEAFDWERPSKEGVID